MTPKPPPTDEQFELLKRVAEKALVHLAIFDEDEVNAALRAVLAYTQLGVETAKLIALVEKSGAAMGIMADIDGYKRIRAAARKLKLAPAVEPKEKQDVE